MLTTLYNLVPECVQRLLDAAPSIANPEMFLVGVALFTASVMGLAILVRHWRDGDA
ncbi:MAG: hypothetical protein KF768_13445 [Phycisphaeraceae bacterium]|nr:hypothetical protein [Phycisphaeraceae bacterium]